MALGRTIISMNEEPVNRSVELSIQLHRAVLPFLRQNWASSQQIIRENLVKQRNLVHSPVALGWIEEWEQATNAGPDAIEAIALQRGERGDDLRQMTPLSGILPNLERWRVVREVQRATQGS